MSGVAVITVVAACAGAVYFERWRVRKAARVRSAVRRGLRPWNAWTEGAPAPEDAARPLARAIDKAVLAGDMAFAYRDRLDPGIAKGESPFEFRRSRIEASVRRYETALDVVTQTADGWLTGLECEGAPQRQRALAVARMIEHLEREGRAAPSMANMAAIDATLDVLENTLANLVFGGQAGRDAHPFR